MKAKKRRKDAEIVMRGGKPAAVILDIDEYRELLERLEGCGRPQDAQCDEKEATQVSQVRGLPSGILPCMRSWLNGPPSAILSRFPFPSISASFHV